MTIGMIISGESGSAIRTCYPLQFTLYPESEKSGSAVIADPEERDFSGDFLLAYGDVYLISGSTPKDGKNTLKLADGLEIFDRDVFMPEGTWDTLGEFISDIVEDEWIEQSDTHHRRAYLDISDESTAAYVAPVLDSGGLFNLCEFIQTARAEGLRARLTVAPGGDILLKLEDIPAVLRRIIPGDGLSELSSAAFTDADYEKITVRRIISEEPESHEDTDWYLGPDGQATSTPPSPRAAGGWGRTSCKKDADPQEAAQKLFDKNQASHKIEFYDFRKFDVGDPVGIKLRSGVYETRINQIKMTEKDSRRLYVCGDLPTTLTEQLAEAQKKEKKK